MNIGIESDKGEKRLLKTHRASTLSACLQQRGLIVIRPGDSGPHRHVVLFRSHHFISAFLFLNDKFEIKIPGNTFLFCSSLRFTTLVRRSARTSAHDTVFKARKAIYLCAPQSVIE